MKRTRCILCGRFMDDDAVLLGYSYSVGNGEEYAHAECVHRLPGFEEEA